MWYEMEQVPDRTRLVRALFSRCTSFIQKIHTVTYTYSGILNAVFQSSNIQEREKNISTGENESKVLTLGDKNQLKSVNMI